MSIKETMEKHRSTIKVVLGALASIAVAFGIYEEEHLNSILALVYSIGPLLWELLDIL